MASSSKKPVFEQVYFPVRVAVFAHEGDEGSVNYSTKVTKSFRRSEDADWENSEYLSPEDLLPAAQLLEQAYRYVQTEQQARYQQRRAERAA